MPGSKYKINKILTISIDKVSNSDKIKDGK